MDVTLFILLLLYYRDCLLCIQWRSVARNQGDSFQSNSCVLCCCVAWPCPPNKSPKGERRCKCMCEGKKMWYAGLEDKHSLLPGRQTCHARPGRGAGIDQNFVTISFQKKIVLEEFVTRLKTL